MLTKELFIYSWHEDRLAKENTILRVYGVDKFSNNICLIINNFKPWCYLEIIGYKEDYWILYDKVNSMFKPLKLSIVEKYKLYGYNRKKYFYFKMTFNSKTKMHWAVSGKSVLKDTNLPLKFHEHKTSPILQFCSKNKILTTGWVQYDGSKVETSENICNQTWIISSIKALENVDEIPNLKVMAWDIEANSKDITKFPNAKNPDDSVFQISCVFKEMEKTKKYLLSINFPDQNILGEDVVILPFSSERELIIGFVNLIRTEKPNITIGYNTFNFDIPFLFERSKRVRCETEFSIQGFNNRPDLYKNIKWNSSAYKNQCFEFYDTEGIVPIDLLPIIQRDYKLDSYSLNNVSKHFLKKKKLDLPVTGIFKCYKIGTSLYKEESSKALAICGKYCIMDSVLVMELFDKLNIWISLISMAKTCMVPVLTLYTQGQQIKVYSQIYNYCYKNDIVVETDAYEVKEEDRYAGAFVVDPIPGIYTNVIPLDFSSLYPSIIRAYNIDYSTLVTDEEDITDEMCNILEWEDHYGC